jgi:hypothetical protein
MSQHRLGLRPDKVSVEVALLRRGHPYIRQLGENYELQRLNTDSLIRRPIGVFENCRNLVL